MLSHSLTSSRISFTHSLTHLAHPDYKMSEHSTVCLHGGGFCEDVVQFMSFMHANARSEPQKISDGQWA